MHKKFLNPWLNGRGHPFLIMTFSILWMREGRQFFVHCVNWQMPGRSGLYARPLPPTIKE